jgi:hypothetical protein
MWSWYTVDPQQNAFSGTLSSSRSQSTAREPMLHDVDDADDAIAGGVVQTVPHSDPLTDPWRQFAFRHFDSTDRPTAGDFEAEHLDLEMDQSTIATKPTVSLSTATVQDLDLDVAPYAQLMGPIPDYHRSIDE